MRILVIGAGAIGGYFGGRLLAAGRDVTFLVRPKRAAQLAATGLVLHGKVELEFASPPTIEAAGVLAPFDLIIVSCKAPGLDAAIEAFAPAVGHSTTILPLLNGIGHLDTLARRFGSDKVLGGLCQISLALDERGHIRHLNDLCVLTYGELDGVSTPRLAEVAATLGGMGVDGGPSGNILQDMWEKWMFIATAAGITCLMRAAIGDIVAAGGAGLTLALLDEVILIATAQGYKPRLAATERARKLLTAEGSLFTASMLRDVESGHPTEADHVLGDLLARAGAARDQFPVLQSAYTHLKAYEARRTRLDR